MLVVILLAMIEEISTEIGTGPAEYWNTTFNLIRIHKNRDTRLSRHSRQNPNDRTSRLPTQATQLPIDK